MIMFVFLEIKISGLVDSWKAKKIAPQAGNEVSKQEPKHTKTSERKLTAAEQWQAVMLRLMNGSFYGKAMATLSVFVQIVLVVTESAWYAYFAAKAENAPSRFK